MKLQDLNIEVFTHFIFIVQLFMKKSPIFIG